MDASVITITDIIRLLGLIATIFGSVFTAVFFFMKKRDAHMEGILEEHKKAIQEQELRAQSHDDILNRQDKKLDIIIERLQNKVDRDEYREGIQRAHAEREKLEHVVENHENRITSLEQPTVFGLIATIIGSTKRALIGNRKLI